jgi:hypothetical protein
MYPLSDAKARRVALVVLLSRRRRQMLADPLGTVETN